MTDSWVLKVVILYSSSTGEWQLASQIYTECHCYGLNVCVPFSQLTCWNLMPNVMNLGGGDFGRWMALINGIRAFIKEAWESSLAPFCHWKAQQEVSSLQPRRTLTRAQPHWYADLGFPASNTTKNKYLLFISQLVVFCYSSSNGLRQLLFTG